MSGQESLHVLLKAPSVPSNQSINPPSCHRCQPASFSHTIYQKRVFFPKLTLKVNYFGSEKPKIVKGNFIGKVFALKIIHSLKMFAKFV